MNVMTVLGTRPEIIRLSRVIEKLDRLCDHTLVHTGQNYDPRLSDVFFSELGVRAPDVVLGASGRTIAEQIAQILVGVEEQMRERRPDRLLILGDTNSGLSAVVAKRLGIPVYHMEAGNRCYDDRVPEEVNRRIIDHCSDVLMPYTEGSRANLLREGFPGPRVYVTGNPIHEVIEHYRDRIDSATALPDLGLEPGRYFLITMHRAENVDREDRLRALAASLEQLRAKYELPVICSLHPRTRSRMQAFGLDFESSQIRYVPPLGFFDFVRLEREAFCVLSDSGTVQEECSIFGVPNVTMRDVTERPETIECGSNMLSGVDPAQVTSAVATVLTTSRGWRPPPEYLVPNVSDTVVKLTLGYRPPGTA